MLSVLKPDMGKVVYLIIGFVVVPKIIAAVGR